MTENINCIACNLIRTEKCKCTYVPAWLFKTVSVAGLFLVISITGLMIAWNYDVLPQSTLDIKCLKITDNYVSPFGS